MPEKNPLTHTIKLTEAPRERASGLDELAALAPEERTVAVDAVLALPDHDVQALDLLLNSDGQNFNFISAAEDPEKVAALLAEWQSEADPATKKVRGKALLAELNR